MIETLRQDTRYAIRQLREAPGFAAVAILTLALGIGATVAIWSVVRAVLLAPLPYRQPESLALIWERLEKTHFPKAPSSAPDVLDMRRAGASFAAIAATDNVSEAALLGDGGEPEQIRVGGVSANFFDVLGVPPALGRTFVPEDGSPLPPGRPGDPRAVGPPNALVLAHGFFLRRFGGDPRAIGRQISLGGQPAVIVGVMPPDFALYMPPDAGMPTDIAAWAPFRFDFAQVPRDQQFLRVIGRLRSGASLAAARGEMAALAGELRRKSPFHQNVGTHIDVVPLHADVVSRVRPVLLALAGAVGFVLLIACANVANLLLARATARRREMAVRSALGASRARLARQALTEALLLALSGGAAGVVLAQAGLRLLLALRPADIPRLGDAGLDVRALAFALGASLVSAVVFGLAPSLAASIAKPGEALRGTSGGGGSRSAPRQALVVAEVAASIVLLVGAGLLLRTFRSLERADLGFRPGGVLTFSLQLPFSAYPQPQDQVRFHRQIEARIAALSGVRSVGSSYPLPLSGRFWTGPYGLPEQGFEEWSKNDASLRPASPGIFGALGLELQRGHGFDRADDESGRHVAVVDRTLSDRLWPGENPLGKRLGFDIFGTREIAEVIGVVSPVRHDGPAAADRATIYFPLHVFPFGPRSYAVRAAGDPAALTRAIRGQVAAVDKSVPIANVRTLDEAVEKALAPSRFAFALLSLFAALALLLATIGLYGVLAYSVRQRTREIGVRVALGAGRGRILRLIVGQGARLALLGLSLGIPAALALGRLLSGLLYGVEATDPATFVGVALVVSSVALWASSLPAVRAARIDPARTLGAE
ncbi:MAG TPA: ABC transporter permease [Thermoanaerobaculia bacterium]|nr:ABC transporter permease [Thermoanaerobaculia bacterium]